MNNWDDLLLTGGFAPRADVLRGLTPEQVGARPHGAPHSIYQELWHAARCQKITLDGGVAALEAWKPGEHFPKAAAPGSRHEWDELVTMFLSYSERAVHRSADEAWLGRSEADTSGWTRRNALEFLAVHNAYHLGKIVLLQQLLGVWNPAR